MASSISMPKYRMVDSNFPWPSKSCTALKFPVLRRSTSFWFAEANAWRLTLVSQPSEIRLVSSWNCGIFFGAVFMRIFGADVLGPVAEYAPIGFGCGPSGCEDAFVLDRVLELQCLALIAGGGRPCFTDAAAPAVLFSPALPCFLRGFIIDEPITFHHVQSLGEWRAVLVDGGIRPDFKSDGVDHQSVVFVMAHGVPVPRRCHLCGMRLVHAHASDFMILVIKHRDLVGLLQ